MAFIVVGGNVVSYAEALDVRDKDQRLFESNEIDFTNVPDAPASLDEYIEDLTTKATNRINAKIRASAQWREYLAYAGGSTDIDNLPAFNPNYILTRKADFTDMCCYYTMKEYLLPKVAEFGNPESPDVMKITYYEKKFYDLYNELLAMMDWYDFDGSGAVDSGEKKTTFSFPRRTRSRRNIARVR
jgi:hypothetical protein